MHEPITITPHWGDHARDLYWRNPTRTQFAALFLVAVGLSAVAVALI